MQKKRELGNESGLHGVLLLRLGILVTVGCASQPPFPESSLTGRIVDVKVGESLTPNEITANQGDEVRWVNTTSATVDLSFDQSLDGIVSCQKGFVSGGWVSRLGSSEVEFLMIAKLHNSDYAGLCFSTPSYKGLPFQGGNIKRELELKLLIRPRKQIGIS